MRFFLSRLLATLVPLAAALVLASCGGGSTTPPAIAKVVIVPNPVSINQGAVVQLTAQAVDSTGALTANQPAMTFNVTNNGGGAVSISSVANNSVQLCAGTWDATFINCTPGPVSSTATITATGGGFTSDPAPVFVHVKVGRVTITTAPGGCTSQGATFQLAAKVFDVANNDITASVGPVTWTSAVVGVATVDTNGLVTGVAPGHSGVFASAGGVNSLPFDFNTCFIEGIALSSSNLTLAPNATQQLNAIVVDTQNNSPTSNPPLLYNVIPAAVASSSPAGLITALQPGTATLVASCTPPNCNGGSFPDAFFPIYSNPLTLTVTGTTSTTVFVSSTQAPPTGTSPKVLPITTTNNTVGTAINLGDVPYSMFASPNGGKAYIGTNSGMVVLDMAANSVTTTVTNAPGVVFSVSPDSNKTLVQSGNQVFIVNNSNGNIVTLNLGAAATHASWTPDSYETLMVAGSNTFAYSPAFGNKPLGVNASDVSFLTSGPFAYMASGTDVVFSRTCDNSTPPSSAGTFTAPLLVKSLPNAALVVAAEKTTGKLDVITPTVTVPTGVNPNPCAALSVSNSSTVVDLGLGAFTPKQIIVTPDSNYVFVLPTGIAKLARYKTSDGSVTAVTLAGACTEPTRGDVTLDSATLYVGCAGSNDVHVINVASATDTAQIATSFQKSDGTPAAPDIIVVRPH